MEALRRMLSASRDTFSLSIAVCNSPALRDHLIESVHGEDPTILRVVLPSETTNVLDSVLAAVQECTKSNAPEMPQPPSAIMIVDMDQSLPSAAEDHPLLMTLNASRELWGERFACPIVFWLPEYAVTLLATTAKDFWAWRSHQFDFVSESATALTGMADRYSGNFGWALNLDHDQRRFRIAELEQRLEELGDDPAAVLLPHAAVWLGELGFQNVLLGELKRAERMYHKAVRIFERIGSLEGMATGYGHLGLIYLQRGDLAEAERMLRNELEIEEKIGRQEGIGCVYAALGNVYLRLDDLAEAERMKHQALEIFEKIGRLDWMANQYNDLGNIYCRGSSLQQGEKMFLRALAINEKLGRLEGMAGDYGNLGNICLKRGDLAEAEKLHRKALEIFEELGLLRGIAITYGNLGGGYKLRGDDANARAYWTKALDLYTRIGMKPEVEKAQRWLDELPQGRDDSP